MSGKVILEKHLEESLCAYPELIEDSLFGIRQGMDVLGPNYANLRRQDLMPNGRIADMVFVEESRITVAEIKKGPLKTREHSGIEEDVVDQICDYLNQSRIKYPGRGQYKGFIIGTGIADRFKLRQKIDCSGETIIPLIFGMDIPSTIKICPRCNRAVGYFTEICVCGTKLSHL
jgi:hypothetical protein